MAAVAAEDSPAEEGNPAAAGTAEQAATAAVLLPEVGDHLESSSGCRLHQPAFLPA